MRTFRVALLLAALLCVGASCDAATLSNEVCSLTIADSGRLQIELRLVDGERAFVSLTPSFAPWATCAAKVRVGDGEAVVRLLAQGEVTIVRAKLLQDGCRLRVRPESPRWEGFLGTATGTAEPLYAAHIALDEGRKPTVHGGGDVLHIGAGRASNRSMNALYSAETFRGVLFDAVDRTPDLRPAAEGHSLRLVRGELTIRTLDVWPLIGWRPASGYSTYGHPESASDHVIPREWLKGKRPFPWERLSPVQLPFISITKPEHFDQVTKQVDFLAENLRDWGFYCFGEWPLTQRNPDYDGPSRAEYLEGNRRTCDYAHSKGIKILRWVTDPDIQPEWYPELHRRFLERGWFSSQGEDGEWLPDYTNPGVQKWLEGQYADLAATGPDFYWVDNNHPTRPVSQPDRFPPDAFREFYLAIQRGLLSTGRDDILIRSGASAWADYSAAGVLDVYAPGPDVQNDWTEQQIYVAQELARQDYLCHFNLWRRCIDDYFPAGPQTIDQTRAMATLLGLTGLSFTTTDIGLPSIPADRLQMLRRLVPVAPTRPMELCRFDRGSLPRWWVLNQVDDDGRQWQVAGVFNWGLESEEQHFITCEELGLDPATEYLAYDFWSQRPLGRFLGAIGLRVAPTSGPTIALHPLADRPFLVATDRHVTMGASELSHMRWAEGVLSARLDAGVPGETFHLTVYCPDGRVPSGATVDGADQPLQALTDGLWQLTVPCGDTAPEVRVSFSRTPLPVESSGARSVELPPYIDADRMVHDLADPREAGSVLRRAAAGQAVVLESPPYWSPSLASVQETLGLHWGLYRGPDAGAPWQLTVPMSQDDAPDGLLWRGSCVAFAPATAEALLRPVGKGLVAAIRPCDGSPEWERLLGDLTGDPAETLAKARTQAAAARAQDTSTVGAFELNEALTEGTATLSLSPTLSQLDLGFHFRRLSRSLVEGEWSTPRIEMSVNGQDLPHKYNPCRPESPPQEWDSLYFTIPAGLLHFDGTDRVTIRSARPAGGAEALASDLRTGLELVIETPAVAGETELVPSPRIAVVPPTSLDALLGLDGGVRYLRRGPGAELTISDGKPYNGWPSRPGGVTHCLFNEQEFTLTVAVPRSATGKLEAFAFDYEAYRRQELVFEDAKPVAVEQFGEGKWLSFPFTAAQSADGQLTLTVRNVQGGNCVLSRLRLVLETD